MHSLAGVAQIMKQEQEQDERNRTYQGRRGLRGKATIHSLLNVLIHASYFLNWAYCRIRLVCGVMWKSWGEIGDFLTNHCVSRNHIQIIVLVKIIYTNMKFVMYFIIMDNPILIQAILSSSTLTQHEGQICEWDSETARAWHIPLLALNLKNSPSVFQRSCRMFSKNAAYDTFFLVYNHRKKNRILCFLDMYLYIVQKTLTVCVRDYVCIALSNTSRMCASTLSGGQSERSAALKWTAHD
jgi:hypothetical protein